jgi:hypothetical protein
VYTLFFSALLLELYLPTEQLTALEVKPFYETYQSLLWWKKKDWGRKGGWDMYHNTEYFEICSISGFLRAVNEIWGLLGL